MIERLPLFRPDISVSLHHENNETYLVLNDVFGYAEGPIMIHSDMMPVLEACNGLTTWDELGDGTLQIRAFIGQLSQMGYFDDENYRTLRANVDADWNALDVRPATCAGSTYPAHVDELTTYLDNLLEDPLNDLREDLLEDPHEDPHEVFLIPHIDFRVAPHVYAEAFRRVGNADADLFVIVGTSHYWGEHRVILTHKHFDTPQGVVSVDRDLVDDLATRLRAHDATTIDILAPNDLAHKPEHSIELHTVLLNHVRKGRPFTILPILVTGVAGEHDPHGVAELQRVAEDVRAVVDASGRRAVWLISGDLAHVGMRFGDDVAASEMLDDVTTADQELLGHLGRADVSAYHEALERIDHRYRVCGHAPTILALHAAKPLQGEVLAYDVWDDSDTSSAVTFAAVAFSR